MFGLQTDYSQTIQALCTHLLEEEKARIMLVPHVIGTSEHRESDTSACRQVMRKFAGEQQQCDIMLVDDITEHREIKYAIGQCDFFIGSRMHSCIAAFSQAVPAVGLAYSDKFQGVLHSIGMADLVVDLRTTSTAVVLERVGKEFSRRKQLRQQLENRMPAVREQARGLLSGNGVSATL
jgi:polysaccharide pyruvyl transferase WcaK-like protein